MTSSVLRSDRFRRWLNQRMPPANAITLDQRKIFILPTRQGLYFALLVVFMVMAGINYQNSLVFGLAFLLASMFMVSILHTFRNLSGLTIQAGGSKPAFAGEDAEFTVILTRHGARTYEALQLGWNPELLADADLIENTDARLRLFVQSQKRGLLNPGRMLVQTYYPVGLFRAWSWVDLDVSTVIYPSPVPAGPIPSVPSTSNEGDMMVRDGVEDFSGFREYQPGDPLRHVAWKSYARSDELLTKEYSAFADRRVWLEWEHFQGMDREARLSRLCYWVVQLARGSDTYGLRLPGVEIEPDNGLEHRERVLKTLALFEQPTMSHAE